MDSIASAESETEDERQRILAGILAEEDDDSVVDVINNDSGAARDVANFDSTRNSLSQQQEQQQQQHLPDKILSRKRIESENAFSSSSDDDFDGTDLEGIYGRAPVTTTRADSLHGRQKAEVKADDDTDFSWTQSAGCVDRDESRNNAAAVQGVSQSSSSSSGANNNITQEDVSPRRIMQSSFDYEVNNKDQEQLDEDAAATAFSFESTAAKVSAAAAKMAAPMDNHRGAEQQQSQTQDRADEDYLAQAEHQVLDEILNNDDEAKDGLDGEAAATSNKKGDSKTSQYKTNVRNKASMVLSSSRQKISSAPTSVESSANPSMMMLDTSMSITLDTYYKNEEERESMRRAFQQCISAAVLVSLAHKRYERRRLAAMEIEKVVRSLVSQDDFSRVRAILLLLSDDYVRSTNEDARKGGVVALAACAIGLKKANVGREVLECRDLILASVVHACQDHSQRVRYYATESLFNVTKVIPSLAVQHFFILFEILRSLYADVDLDVRSGAELLDKKLKEVIVGAINSGSFSADACVPVFARFVYMRNKATKQLTLTWLQEFSEKLIGAPILEFLHLFLGGIFAMVSDPNTTIRQLALDFLQVRRSIIEYIFIMEYYNYSQ